jgi:hypothetical protein
VIKNSAHIEAARAAYAAKKSPSPRRTGPLRSGVAAV